MDYIIDEKLEIYIKKTKKTLIKTLNDHFNKLITDNFNMNYICKINDVKKILFIKYIIKNTKNKIYIYESDNNIKKEIKQINKISDLDNYSFVALYIEYDEKTLYNIFTYFDFKKMIKNAETIMFLKIILSLRGIVVDDILKETKIHKMFPSLTKSPIEIFYEICILRKEYNIINKEYKINIRFLNKHKKIKHYLHFYF